MATNNSIFLEVTNIIWSESTGNNKKLPKKLKLQWNSNEWDYDQVSSWLSEYFHIRVNSFNVKELEEQKSSGG